MRRTTRSLRASRRLTWRRVLKGSRKHPSCLPTLCNPLSLPSLIHLETFFSFGFFICFGGYKFTKTLSCSSYMSTGLNTTKLSCEKKLNYCHVFVILQLWNYSIKKSLRRYRKVSSRKENLNLVTKIWDLLIIL